VKYIPTMFAIVTLVSTACMTTKVHQHNLPCHTRTKADVIRSSMALLVQHGFTVTLSDTITGLIQAETAENRDVWTGNIEKRVWQIGIRPELDKSVLAAESGPITKPADGPSMYVIATAKTVNRTQNAFGATLATSEVYYSDAAHEDWEWYWDIRRGLESVCGAKVVISTKKLH